MQSIKGIFQTSITTHLENARAFYIIASNDCWCIPRKQATQYWQVDNELVKDLKYLFRLIYLKTYVEQN